MKRLLAFLLAFTFLLSVALSEEEAIPPIEEPIVEVQEEAEVVEPIEEEEPPIEELPEEVAEAPPEELPIEEEEEQPEEFVELPAEQPPIEEEELIVEESKIEEEFIAEESIESEEESSETPTEFIEISEEVLATPVPEPELEQEPEPEEEEPIVEEEISEDEIESEEVIVPEEIVEIAEGDWGYVDPEIIPREVHITFLTEPKYFGDEATIVATLVNFRPEDNYTIYWQYCTDATLDEPDWITIEGENSRLYSFIVDRDNYQYGYRVLVQMED